MKNGHDDQEHRSNIVSLAGARKQAEAARARKSRPAAGGERRPTIGQWLVSATFLLFAIGGMLALAAPLLRAAGIVGE